MHQINIFCQNNILRLRRKLDTVNCRPSQKLLKPTYYFYNIHLLQCRTLIFQQYNFLQSQSYYTSHNFLWNPTLIKAMTWLSPLIFHRSYLTQSVTTEKNYSVWPRIESAPVQISVALRPYLDNVSCNYIFFYAYRSMY